MTEDNKKPNAATQSIPSSVNPDAEPVNDMNQNDTTEDRESGIEHLRCSRCNDSVGIIKEDGQHYAICHCTNADGEIDRMELESLDSLYPSRWVYV